MRTIFFGTDLFAKEILRFLLDQNITPLAIVTRPDKPKGRAQKLLPPPVKELIQERALSIPVFQPVKASDPLFIEEIRKLTPDLFIVVSYGQIIREALLNVPKIGPINIHPSLLPKFRGPSPIQSAVLAGERETGVTIMKMDAGMDTGDILLVKKIPLPETMTYGELEGVLCEESKRLLLEVLEKIEKEGKIVGTPQPHEMATYTEKITPEQAIIDWSRSTFQILNHIRGMNPRPGAKCFIELHGKKKELKIFEARLAEEKGAKNSWIVATGDGAIEIMNVQLEGKRRMTTKDFLNGLMGSFHLL